MRAKSVDAADAQCNARVTTALERGANDEEEDSDEDDEAADEEADDEAVPLSATANGVAACAAPAVCSA